MEEKAIYIGHNILKIDKKTRQITIQLPPKTNLVDNYEMLVANFIEDLFDQQIDEFSHVPIRKLALTWIQGDKEGD